MSSPRRSLAVPDHASTRPALPGRRFRRAIGVAAAVALTLTACGSGEDTVSSDDAVEQSEAVSDAEIVDDAAEAEVAALQETGPIDVTGDPLAPYDSSIDDIAVGTAAPVVGGQSFDGSEIVIGAPTDNPTLVVFLAHWCPHCNDEIPELLALEEEGRLPEGLDVVGVSTAATEGQDNYPPSEWIVEKGWQWPTMADDEVGTAITVFGGTSFPFAVVLDADGTVLARRAGSATGDETVEFLESALATAAS